MRRAEEPPPSRWAWIRLPLKLGLWPLWAQACSAQPLGLNGAPSRLSDSSTLDSSVFLQVSGVESGIRTLKSGFRTLSHVCREGLGACRQADSQGALKSAAHRGWRSHLSHDWTVERHRVTNQRPQPGPGRLQSPRFRAQAHAPGKDAAVGGRAEGGGFTWTTQPAQEPRRASLGQAQAISESWRAPAYSPRTALPQPAGPRGWGVSPLVSVCLRKYMSLHF